jgi:hypothetical protein
MARFASIVAGVLSVAMAASPALAAPADPAPATKASDNTVTGVTVTAEKPDPLVDKTTQFVRSHMPENREGQLARFRDRICVRVVGLPATHSAFIQRRVMQVAEAAHARVDRTAGCTANVNVIFSPNPQAQLDDIAKRREVLFGYYFVSQLKKLATFNRPIQSWYLTRTVGTDGIDVLELNQSRACISSYAPGTSPCDIKAPAITGRAGSRLGTDMSSELVHSLILVDANKVADAKIGAIADYIAVLALSRWQELERCNAVPTILNLMADDCEGLAPEAATDQDKALLAALYASDPRESGDQQRMAIAARMSQAAKAH